MPSRVLLVGLAATLGLGALAANQPATAGPARVVVAVPDGASNPYHEFFHQNPSVVTPEILAEFGVDDDHIIELTITGDWYDDFDEDADKFAAVKPGELYWFKGTNLFGISFSPGGVPLLVDGGESTHGVGTTSAVATANPDAIIISVEGTNTNAESWAFTTPFVDIVSTSYGIPGSVPVPTHNEDSYTGVVTNGKFHVGASDNSPALSPFDTTSGPWWSLAVAGLHEDEGRSREGLSGNVVDFVSDFTQDLPYCGACEDSTRNVSGTSFATPRIAGTISRLLLDARRAAGHVGGIITEGEDVPVMARGNGFDLTNWDLRRALEEAAWYPDSSQDSAPGGAGTYGVPSEAPYAVIGWGLVTPDDRFDVLRQARAHLGLVDEDATRFKSAAACEYMTGTMEARRTYWNQANAGSQGFGSANYPYVAC